MKKVIMSTDGACIGNPGPGGWACVLRFGDRVGELYGCDSKTTNNRMELMAVIRGLEALKEPSEVSLSIDSQYVQLGISEWIHKWKRNGWRTSTKKDVLNKDLWIELDALVGRHKIRWEWVKGHAQHADNNRCDELANRAAREQVSSAGVMMVS
jgi:ribonuclease HI